VKYKCTNRVAANNRFTVFHGLWLEWSASLNRFHGEEGGWIPSTFLRVTRATWTKNVDNFRRMSSLTCWYRVLRPQVFSRRHVPSAWPRRGNRIRVSVVCSPRKYNFAGRLFALWPLHRRRVSRGLGNHLRHRVFTPIAISWLPRWGRSISVARRKAKPHSDRVKLAAFRANTAKNHRWRHRVPLTIFMYTQTHV
jgi:hypothetical protein